MTRVSPQVWTHFTKTHAIASNLRTQISLLQYIQDSSVEKRMKSRQGAVTDSLLRSLLLWRCIHAGCCLTHDFSCQITLMYTWHTGLWRHCLLTKADDLEDVENNNRNDTWNSLLQMQIHSWSSRPLFHLQNMALPFGMLLPLLIVVSAGVYYIYNEIILFMSKSLVRNKVVVITDAVSGVGTGKSYSIWNRYNNHHQQRKKFVVVYVQGTHFK